MNSILETLKSPERDPRNQQTSLTLLVSTHILTFPSFSVLKSLNLPSFLQSVLYILFFVEDAVEAAVLRRLFEGLFPGFLPCAYEIYTLINFSLVSSRSSVFCKTAPSPESRWIVGKTRLRYKRRRIGIKPKERI